MLPRAEAGGNTLGIRRVRFSVGARSGQGGVRRKCAEPGRGGRAGLRAGTWGKRGRRIGAHRLEDLRGVVGLDIRSIGSHNAATHAVPPTPPPTALPTPRLLHSQRRNSGRLIMNRTSGSGPRMRPSVERAYRMTRYEVAGVTFHIGRNSPGLDRMLCCHGVRVATFVTAYNPRSQRMPPAWNRRMQARLIHAARHVPLLEGRGCWRGWCESHILLLGDPRPAIRLARRFRQNAVVIVRLRQAARLLSTS